MTLGTPLFFVAVVALVVGALVGAPPPVGFETFVVVCVAVPAVFFVSAFVSAFVSVDGKSLTLMDPADDA
jgi:hypothetical protein